MDQQASARWLETLKAEGRSKTKWEGKYLTAEQQRGWDLVMREHRNVFVSGRAGCGKSFLVHHLVRALRRQHTPSTVFVTATTGVAACNIHGTTVHSFAGIGLGREDAAQLLAAMRPPAIKRWRAATVWVIDEISMLNAALLEKLNTIAQTLRGNKAPMGGIRVIAVGDFFQLPPVPDRGTRAEEVQFAFESSVWKALFPSQCLIDLRTQMRQKDDPMLERLLNNIRVGNVPADAAQVFAAAGSGLEALRTRGLKPTKLFATKKQVAAVNRAELARLDGRRRPSSWAGGDDPATNLQLAAVMREANALNVPRDVRRTTSAPRTHRTGPEPEP